MKKIIALVLVGLFISTNVLAGTTVKYKKLNDNLFEKEETSTRELSRESLEVTKAHLELNIINAQREIDKLQEKIDKIDAILNANLEAL